ncbi:hypothetical protein EZV62_009789 [Acer yangbiense]|uniref:CSC1/OSCA1-like 7TM region domain-containing protein n=1 Tax=Acer yangbiense TaxID=1000413 RepID=A0A5C7I151_9ROSI|nr:hypothetical protein EZV62_009789 [Acer yangbiense]
MDSLEDLLISLALNISVAVIILCLFSILRLIPKNKTFYFRTSPYKVRWSLTRTAPLLKEFLNFQWRNYFKVWIWIVETLEMPEPALIKHAGLDSTVYLRIYILGLKILCPICLLAFCILVPVNWTGQALHHVHDTFHSDIDKLSISNIPYGSNKLHAHIAMCYVFTLWTLYILYEEYKKIADMRHEFLKSRDPCAEEFTVLVRNIPVDPDNSINDQIEHFFRANYPYQYLTHQVVYNTKSLSRLTARKERAIKMLNYYRNKNQRMSENSTIKTGWLGLWGKRMDAIGYYAAEVENRTEEENSEKDKLTSDDTNVIRAAFVSFKTCQEAAKCSQSQQAIKATKWVTESAPEPRDIYWDNLLRPWINTSIRKMLVWATYASVLCFYMIPIAVVQSMENLEEIKKLLPKLAPVIEKLTHMGLVKQIVQLLIPGITLKIARELLRIIIEMICKMEGCISHSSFERRSAERFFWFYVGNIFLGNVLTGTIIQLHRSPFRTLKVIGSFVPLKAKFFMSTIMVDIWAEVAVDILNLVKLLKFRLNPRVKYGDEAVDPAHLLFSASEPQVQYYLLLGLVYAVITPLILPFVIFIFLCSYLVYSHQVINFYDKQYESGAVFWPTVHRHIIYSVVISEVLLMLMLSIQGEKLTPLLIPLPFLTLGFLKYSNNKFRSAFFVYPIEAAMVKDIIQQQPTQLPLDLNELLQDAYMHPSFKGG